MTSTVTAVVVGHRDRNQIDRMLYHLIVEQTQSPDEIIACVCCCDIEGLSADIIVRDAHKDDVGQRLCDYGLRLASSDYVFFASCDDEYDPNFLEEMLAQGDGVDLIHCDFHSWRSGHRQSVPRRCDVTRGSFLVRRELAQRVGYNHRDYEGDGKFVEDVMAAGATERRVPIELHRHR